MADPTLLRLITDVGKGRFGGYGAGQNDTYHWEDNVDTTHGLRLPWVVPSNTQRIMGARLTVVLYAYRTYNSFSGTATGAETGHTHSHTHGTHTHSHDHGGHAHSHTHGSHAHATAIGSVALAQALTTDGAGSIAGTTGPNASVATTGTTPTSDATSTTPTADATATAPSADASASSGHTHSVALATASAITEGATANNVSVFFDGVDKTAALGGPFVANQIELNVMPYLSTTQGVLHTITLTPTTLGRIHAILRLSSFVDASIA